MKKIIGAFLLLAVFSFLFSMLVMAHGIGATMILILVSCFFAATILGGLHLLLED